MKIGSSDISAAYIGSTAINKVYIGSTEVWSSFDPDAAAFFARVTTAGGSLSATEQTAVNTLVIQMKADGIWSKMKAVYPMVGASAAACAQNLKSSSFTGTFTSGWTFASTGATPNGTSAYFNTTLSPNGNLMATSTHISYYSRTLTTTNAGIEAGVWDSGFLNGIQMALNRSGVGTYLIINTNSGTQINSATQDSDGFFIGTRTANNFVEYFKNNSSIGTNSNTYTTGLSSNNIYIGAGNDFGTASKFSSKECGFSSIGDGLSSAEASDFYTAVQAFQTTLSRQV